ncbi:MAG TPA: hypothetical protein VF557_10895 [Jatrophihabitans sp.]|jgi:hypothetical protein|uniref:hypothetical protein n=1 Tax=Jatrophihabitans sp. TaxID=1932789 RepID=UPI002EF4411A
MRRLSRTAIAVLAAAGLMLTPGTVAAAPAPEGSTADWNCREVTAQDISFFASSTGNSLTDPLYLYTGYRFRSHGNYDGRFLAQIWAPIAHYNKWGYTTSDSRWVKQIHASFCW